MRNTYNGTVYIPFWLTFKGRLVILPALEKANRITVMMIKSSTETLIALLLKQSTTKEHHFWRLWWGEDYKHTKQKRSVSSLSNKMWRTLSTSHCLTDTKTTLKLLHKYWPISVKQKERWPSSTCLSHHKGTNLTGLSSAVQIFRK